MSRKGQDDRTSLGYWSSLFFPDWNRTTCSEPVFVDKPDNNLELEGEGERE